MVELLWQVLGLLPFSGNCTVQTGLLPGRGVSFGQKAQKIFLSYPSKNAVMAL